MNEPKKLLLDRLNRQAELIQRYSGKAVRPYRADGYMNVLNKYGTQRDTSEAYQFQGEPTVPDEVLAVNYESNGLFARIIDAPAEEAIKHGFELKDVSDEKIASFYKAALDELDWEETAMTCIKWARLFGGSIAVLLVNDGRGLEEPINWRRIKSIDDIRVYDRSVVTPDYNSMYAYDPNEPFDTRGSRLGMPEYYYVTSRYGSFTVHESRCLVFQNGILPECASNSVYQLWGMPEYIRIHRAMRDSEIAHGSAVKMLDRSVQPVYKVKDLAMQLATEEGENIILKRLQTIDMSRGLMNTVAIDSEGEEYDFRTFQFAGVTSVVDSTCSYLSALTSIPQSILFGMQPSGLSSGDDSSFESYYNYVERIQKRMVRSNLRYLLSIVFQAGYATGEIDEIPSIDIDFNPLWSMSDTEKADLELKNVQIQQAKANVAATYITNQVIDPTEVRKKLADSDEFDIDTILDEDDLDDDIMSAMMEGQEVSPESTQQVTTGRVAEASDNAGNIPDGTGSAPEAAPAATKLPQDMSDNEEETANSVEAEQFQKTVAEKEIPDDDEMDSEESDTIKNDGRGSVGVIVIKDGKILIGRRCHEKSNGTICGPGGHIEPGETPAVAAVRETNEEFGIFVNEIIPIGRGPAEPDTGLSPYLYLCSSFNGEPKTDNDEVAYCSFASAQELIEHKDELFAPFASSLKILDEVLSGKRKVEPDPYATQMFTMTSPIDNKQNSGIIKVYKTPRNGVKSLDCDYELDESNLDEEKWITVNGTHICVEDDGTVKYAPPSLIGRNMSTIDKSRRSVKAGIKMQIEELDDADEGAVVVGPNGYCFTKGSDGLWIDETTGELVESKTIEGSVFVKNIPEHYREIVNGSDSNEFFCRDDDSMYAKFHKQITTNQAQAIRFYTGSDSAWMNDFYRMGEDQAYLESELGRLESSRIMMRAQEVTHAIDKFELTEPITVYRAGGTDMLKKTIESGELKEGGLYHDDGFMSTTTDKNQFYSDGYGFGDDVQMVIHVPAGNGIGAYIDPLSHYNGEEFEFLLQRGSDLRINSVKDENGKYRLDLTVIGNALTDDVDN